jgi:hypothetical protein
VLCNGFEPPSLMAPCFAVENSATVTIDTAQVARGSGSLHIQTQPVDGATVAQGEATETDVVPAPSFFLRAFVFLPSLPPYFMRIFGLLQAGPPNIGPQLYVDATGHVAISPTDRVFMTSTTTVATGRWICLEWEVQVSSAGESRTWLDGVELTDLHYFGNTDLSPTVGRISMGAAFFGRTFAIPGYELWLDDVAVGTDRVGCQ